MSVDGISAIDQKMQEMRRKNSELLKRHQEIEEDRQRARLNESVESIKTASTERRPMGGTNKNRTRPLVNKQQSQENQQERIRRTTAVRRKLVQDSADIQNPNVQKIDYHRLQKDRTFEPNQGQYNLNQQTIDKADHFDRVHQLENRNKDQFDIDEPTCAKRRVIVNHQANRIGSGRFNQQQQQQPQPALSKQKSVDQGRLKAERMRRYGLQNHPNSDETSEFHLEIPSLNMWQNASIPPSSLPMTHLHLLPSAMAAHPTGIEHMVGDNNDQMEQSNFLPNFIYPSAVNSSAFNNPGPVFFTQAPPLMSTNAPPSQGQPLLQPQPQYPTYHPSRGFENSNRSPFQHHSPFQTPTLFQNTAQMPQSITSVQYISPSTSSNGISAQTKVDDISVDAQAPPRFRRLKGQDYENRYTNSRPMSGDFERLTNTQNSSSSLSSNVNLRFNHDQRCQSRPQSFYGFSSKGSTFNNFSRPSNNYHRQQRVNTNNGNTSLPLSAYMTDEDPSYQSDAQNHQHWNNNIHARRRTLNLRSAQQERHKFPLSCYDPRQYGFTNGNKKRNEVNQNSNGERKFLNESDDIDLIEEWCEDNDKELSCQDQTSVKNDSESIIPPSITTTTISTGTMTTSAANANDSGHSSLSTSIHLRESALDDDDNNPSSRDIVSPPSDLSATDSHIIESLDKLQNELKLEESLEKHLSSNEDTSDDSVDKDLIKTYKSGGFDTAHFMQWAKEKFREELAGRLTAQQIQQHDAVITDDDDDENVDDLVLNVPTDIEFSTALQLIDDEHTDNIDDLKDNLQYKLNIDGLVSSTKEDSVIAE